jgi:hypothetical protein
VHIILRVLRYIVVDHQVDVVDVDAPADHIGGHQHAQLAVAEREHHLFAFGSAPGRCACRGIEAALLQVPVEVLHFDLATGEDHDARGFIGVEDVLQRSAAFCMSKIT